jgi:NAD(P)-dependent dehydrogenase (short-subunit alcohol dehydrogenase family)
LKGVDEMKTVLITGCSSGYGLETARHSHAQGWNVIATMRTPREDVLPRSGRVRVLALDVTRPESIAAAIEAAHLQHCVYPARRPAAGPLRARGFDAQYDRTVSDDRSRA